MKEYEGLEVRLILLQTQDIVTSSSEESADDIGGWNSDWFATSNS